MDQRGGELAEDFSNIGILEIERSELKSIFHLQHHQPFQQLKENERSLRNMKMSTKNDVLFIPGKEGFSFRQGKKKHMCLYKISLNYSVPAQVLHVNQREFVFSDVRSNPCPRPVSRTSASFIASSRKAHPSLSG